MLTMYNLGKGAVLNLKCIGRFVCFQFNRQNSSRQNSSLSFNDFWKRPWIRKSFGTYNIVQPGHVMEEPSIPSHIKCPSYYKSTIPASVPMDCEVKNEHQIAKMRKSCTLARQILEQIEEYIKVGRTTEELNALVFKLSVESGAYPSPLNYRGFPKSVCTSVNNVACHGIPDDRPLYNGDIINVDITVYLDGYHGDCSKTFLVGNVDTNGCKLVDATRQCLENAISICKPGVTFCSIGDTVEETAKEYGFTVVPAFVGHGIGSYFHGPPDIYHCYNDYPGHMAPGIIFTIEPVLAQGSQEIVILEDGWTAVTLDNGRAAQFEHTVLITATGVEVLTK